MTIIITKQKELPVKYYFILILVIPMMMGACKRPNETDSSLTLEEYRKLGVPDEDTIWSLGDYAEAFYVLGELKRAQPFALPTRGSKNSGMLFSRMINLENLSFLQDESLPLYEKAHVVKVYVEVQDKFIDLYTNILMKKQFYTSELVDIYIFGLGVTQKMLELGHRINESEDPSDVRMQAGYSDIQDLYVINLTDYLKIQLQTSEYPQKALELLTDSLSNSVKRNMEWFEKGDSEKIERAIQTVVDSTTSQKIKDDYLDLLEVL